MNSSPSPPKLGLIQGAKGIVQALAAACIAQLITATPAAAAVTKGTSTWTLYYVAEVTEGQVVKNGGIRVKTQAGDTLRVQLSPKVLRKANLEGTVASADDAGKRYVTNFVKLGLWQDLADGWEGMGNRSNPLATYRSVAADQKFHRYGSRIFAPVLVGFTPPGFDQPHDGYLWVADSGGGIKGHLRFDLFVGKQETYDFVMNEEKQKGKWRVPIEVERLPSAPKGYQPKTAGGLRKILEGVGLLEGDGEQALCAALIEFQKKHGHIPQTEYGASGGAVSLWYLTQAALKISKGEKYDAQAASKRAEKKEAAGTKETESARKGS